MNVLALAMVLCPRAATACTSIAALKDGRIAVGAPGNDAVYLFAASSGERLDTLRWPRVLASRPRDRGGFGDQVAAVDRSLLVLAPSERGFSGDPFRGVLYVFTNAG